ncbi:MAG: FAD-dependent 5-carboxymethylaminomethyl-2-thiouridine(34) oxidoreductase MnmC [Psychrobium sp.]|nr:FAD-dependent 5-carboxymethylaminomethyl-2-thiouridine(34) oxidoreductase MnmC [Psychrobium sp.]
MLPPIKHAKLMCSASPQDQAIHGDRQHVTNVSTFISTLLANWLQCDKSFYVIAQIGFGCGLNLLTTWAAFATFRKNNPTHICRRLYFSRFEKHPLTKDDFRKTAKQWPQFADMAAALCHSYPDAIAGCHRQEFPLEYGGHLLLDLWFGDIGDTLLQVPSPASGLINYWFIGAVESIEDNDRLCQTMAKITCHEAMFTIDDASEKSHQSLVTAGFNLSNTLSSIKDSEPLIGTFKRVNKKSSTTSWYYRPTPNALTDVAIIGGGIASATMALSLAKKGINSVIYCQDKQLATAASGNTQGGFYPLLNSNHDKLSQFYGAAFNYGAPLYQAACQKDPALGEFCGVLQIGYDDKQTKRQQRLANSAYFPLSLVALVTAGQASDIAQVTLVDDCLHYPRGAWLNPRQLTQFFIEQAKKLAKVTLLFDHKVATIHESDGGWTLTFEQQMQKQQPTTHQTLILANGHQLSEFEQTKALPFYATAGLVSHIDATPSSNKLRSVLCYRGYMTPQADGQHNVGASFKRDVVDLSIKLDEHQQNIDMLLGDTQRMPWSVSLNKAPLAGKTGVRMSVKDHLPMVGAVPHFKETHSLYHDLQKGKPAYVYANAPYHDNLFMLGGLAARGLCSAPLLAEILSCQLTGEPQPISQDLLNQLNPNRYWIKQLKQGKTNHGAQQ